MEFWSGEFNQAADITYGLICVFCSLFGILGNIFSFFFFKAKKRDMSTVIYMLITGCDIVINIFVFPVGTSLLSERKPGSIFGNKYSCAAWVYVWHSGIVVSSCLVACLSITRTLSMFRPFSRLKIRNICIFVLIYSVSTFLHTVWYQLNGGFEIDFSTYTSQCILRMFFVEDNRVLTFLMTLCRGVFYVAPIFVVAVSCVMSAAVLTRKNRNVQQRELQQSRNRATVTILLFALLYEICNIPYIYHIVVQVVFFYDVNFKYDVTKIYSLYKFDVSGYYFTASSTLLIAANSAVNPILYLWRMPRLRVFVLAKLRNYFRVLRRLLGFNNVTMETNQDPVVVEETCS